MTRAGNPSARLQLSKQTRTLLLHIQFCNAFVRIVFMLFALQPYASTCWQASNWPVPASSIAAFVRRLIQIAWSKLGQHLSNFLTNASKTSTRQHDIDAEDDIYDAHMMDEEDTLDGLEMTPRRSMAPVTIVPRESYTSSGGPNSAIITSSADRIGPTSSPTTKTTIVNATATQMGPPDPPLSRRSPHKHSRSLADITRQGKRLSLNFPVQSANSKPARPPSWASSPTIPPIPSPDRSSAIPSPTENNFLAVLAAQERRVLELKEELGKAEKELVELKKQWAQHEVIRKKQDVKRVTQLQPLQSAPSPTIDSGNDSEDVDGSSTWMHKEMERRKQLLSGVKSSNRKVFSGSRHMRTLSLLSPDKAQGPSYAQPSSDDGTDESAPASAAALRPPPLSRSSTISNPAGEVGRSYTPDSGSESRLSVDLSKLPSDAILTQGKKMASDFKDGLWTFFEDIRQATVGEEAIHGNTARRRPQSMHAGDLNAKQSNGSLRKHGSRGSLQRTSISSSTTMTVSRNKHSRSPAKKPPVLRRPTDLTPPTDVGGSFWREHGLEEPRATAAAKVRPGSRGKTAAATKKASDILAHDTTDDESWDTWDTPGSKANPSPKPIQALAMSSNDSVSEIESSTRSTPRTSTRHVFNNPLTHPPY